MTTTDLDEKLTSMAAPMPESVRAEAKRMATATMPRRLRRGHAPRAPWVLPMIIGGAVALTAGAGTATIAMSHWGSVEMPLNNVRNTEPIPVAWITDSGDVEECRVWLEIRNPQPGDQSALNRAVADHDWTGIGQHLYDHAPAQTDDPDGESRVGDALSAEIQAFANEAFPGIYWFDQGADTSARAVDAWGMTCAPEVDWWHAARSVGRGSKQ